VLPLARLKFY